MNPKALQMLIPSGNPNGMKIIELAGWSGKCFVVPRQNLKELKEREEINQPGLYLLFGIDEEIGSDLVYIGESENFYSRIANHHSNKDFWDTCIIFTGSLNRAFVKYLEYRATTLASEVKRMNIQNKIQPQENTLSEFEKVTVEQYFENVQFILSALSLEVFDAVEESISSGSLYYLRTDGASAKAKALDNGGMLVLEGSLARIYETESFGGWSGAARKRFLNEKKFMISENEDSYISTEDIIFKSPSAAAATFAGRPINGWTSWKDEQGKTLDENLRT